MEMVIRHFPTDDNEIRQAQDKPPAPAPTPAPLANRDEEDPEQLENPEPADPAPDETQSFIQEAVKKTLALHTDSEDSSDNDENYLYSSNNDEEETTQPVTPAPSPVETRTAAKQKAYLAGREKERKNKDTKNLDNVEFVKEQALKHFYSLCPKKPAH